MFFRSASLLLPLAGLISQSFGQECLSYGIDIVGGGEYFINVLSNASFTAAMQFSGCQNDTANVILVTPTGDQYQCTDVPLEPDFTTEMSTCPLEKDDMYSGDWAILVISNNGNADPIAYERDFSLSVGPQSTATLTPTMTFTMTSTPTVTSTSTQYETQNVTISATTTVVIPSATKVFTVTPKKTITTTATSTITRTLKTWTRTSFITTVTQTASCTVPPRPQQPDPTCSIKPTIIPLPSGLSIGAKREELMSPEAKARRWDAIKARRAANVDKRNLAKRSVDVPTITVTETTYTATETATSYTTTSTVLALVVQTTTATITQAIPTLYSGVVDSTITAPTPTKTKYRVNTTYVWSTRTATAYFTAITTVTPTASVTACKSAGGHFGRNAQFNRNGGW